jgi:thiol-disulfide isomerase/thioredoxin
MSRHRALRDIAVVAMAWWATVPITRAAELKPFVAGSMAQIQAERSGKPHVVSLWSLTCPPCHEELALLGEFRRAHPKLQLVLIATDSPQDAPALREVLRRHGLETADNWVFADAFVERLRHEIDPAWYGELPRSYLSDGKTTRTVSGKLNRKQLEAWRAPITRAP